MKKSILYLGIAVIVGLIGGYLIFGNSSNSTHQKETDIHDHSEASTHQMWTCSMHPQIMQPEPGDCPICGMELIPAETGADGLAANEIKMTENALALANVQTTIVGSTIANGNSVKLSGKIVENEKGNTVQVSHFAGRIERLRISTTGAQIKKGQLLATIYSPELFAAQQELITTASLKTQQPALYKAVYKKLKIKKLTDKQIASIEQSGEPIQNFPIYASHSGTVVEKMVEEGDHIALGQPLFKLSNLNTVWANFDVYENQIDVFKKGQEVSITTNTYPNKEFKGKVDFIDPVLDTRTRTVKLRVVLNNKDTMFKPGMFVEGEIEGITSGQEPALYVPSSSVLWTGERSVVYLKTNPNKAVFEMREVTIGTRNGDSYQVVSGLEDGDEIVANGTFTVDAAAQLQGKKSMMNKSGGKTMTGHQGHLRMQDSTANKSNGVKTMDMKLPLTFQIAFQTALQPYLKMKDAFVASNMGQISTFAKTTLEKIKALGVTDLGKMEKAHVSKSVEMLKAISSDPDIENRRAHLVILNENMIALVMNMKSPSETLYVQKCPMADSNKGAMWLSTEKEIKNPYYGNEMLTCGSVIAVINE